MSFHFFIVPLFLLPKRQEKRLLASLVFFCVNKLLCEGRTDFPSSNISLYLWVQISK